MKAVLIKVEYGKDLQFRATAEDWKDIRPHMLPARIDPKPALWEGLADATIIKKDGKSLKVTVWIPARGPGAFSVGGKYYRGGDSSRTLKAIQDAHHRSMKRVHEQKIEKAQQGERTNPLPLGSRSRRAKRTLLAS